MPLVPTPGPLPAITWQQCIAAATSTEQLLRVLEDLCRALAESGVNELRGMTLGSEDDIDRVAVQLRNLLMREPLGLRGRAVQGGLDNIALGSLAYRRLVRRSVVSVGQLYTILNDEWVGQRPDGCLQCRMPLPVRIRRLRDGSANWRIGAPTKCAHGCDAMIAEIASRLCALYDVSDLDETLDGDMESTGRDSTPTGAKPD